MEPKNQFGWQPILVAAERDKALTIVLDIASAIRDTTISNVSLANGAAGIGVFFHYLDDMLPGRGYDEICFDHLNNAISHIASEEIGTPYYTGLMGIGWAVEHVLKQRSEDTQVGEEEDDEEDVNEEMDRVLEILLSQKPWSGHYDLVFGLVGYGAYLLERLPKQSAYASLENIVVLLEEMAQPSGQYLLWQTPPEFCENKEEINLGMAHGLPGILAFLAQLSLRGIVRKRALHLLERAVDWLLKQKLPQDSTSTNGMFPSRMLDGRKSPQSRLAWCYGDPGVSLGLYFAGQALERQELIDFSISLAELCTKRAFEKTRVVDVGLCHGAAGLLQIFNRYYQVTRRAEFRQAALFWLDKIYEFRKPGQHLAGFSAVQFDNEERQINVSQPGILTGVAGVGLAILSACSKQELSWDRMLFSNIFPSAI